MSEEVKEKKPVIAITHGDINGISYEIMLKGLRDSRVYEKFIPVIYGSPKVAAYYKKVLNYNSLNLNHISKVEEAEEGMINIINCISNKVKVEIGKSTEIAGMASLNALRHVLVDIKHKKVDILVTAPINKANVQMNDFNFKGHTDFLKHEFNVDEVLMMMVNDNLRIVVATEHFPISDVPAQITEELLLSKMRLIRESLKNDFGIGQPRIAVLGLNPHCGDGGLIGNEEQNIIIPAIKKANEENILAFGPYSADGFFGSTKFINFDAILAMYHDQGLIPFKILADKGGVNYTSGLPIVRTSPAHGTAYDIAGKNKANPKSFIDALFTAYDIWKNRQIFKNIEFLNRQELDNEK